jgi:DNA polymerase-3 subunit alpha
LAGDSFTHLHVHTEFSMLDGAARVTDLVAKAAADGQPAVGITDHGNMYGVLEFYRECVNQGVKPVIGSELYQAFERRDERPQRRSSKQDDGGGYAEGGRKAYYHLTALAESNTGYRNLIQLASRAYLEGYYMKPKVDWELLEDHHEGLIVTSGCLGGQVLQALVPSPIMEPERNAADATSEDDRFRNALEIAGRFQDIFGRDNFFIEIQDHSIGAQAWSNPKLVQLAQKLRAPLLATNDSHYTHQHEHEAHDALLCVQTGSQMSDTNRLKFHGDQHYFKSAEEMRWLFRELPEACDNTLWIAERSNVEIEFGNPKLPDFPLPEGFTDAAEYLRHLTLEGARDRWGGALPDAVTERLVFELQVIADMGFSSYFLIVWDLIKHARDRHIRVGPGRGSAAGCAVAYCLRITDLDPIKYDLLFERFLNPSRISMPDIDMDFDSRYRDEMIRYAAERYGRDHVAQIVTFSTIKARAAVRDGARVLGYPYLVGDKVAKAMPPLIMGRDTPLWACMSDDPPEKYIDGYKMATDLRQMYREDPDAKKVIDVAKGLEGLRRQDGIHAAAVVITRDPLTEYLPIQRKPEPGSDIELAPVVTQYEMGGVESLGLLKMDFLGLRNLDVITDTVAMIERTRAITVDIDNPPLDDPATYDLLQRGDTIGVFQLESPPMRSLLQRLRPTEFGDVSAVIALYRPGPMSVNMHFDYADRKNGRQKVEYFHADAEEVLGDTQGLMIYQESVMRVSQKFAGYSLAEADNLRKACGKKNRELMAKERQKFVEGCDATGYGPDLGNSLFDVIEKFADYAFNKSHTFGYGLITYQTAYLKANFPVEYFACLLTSVKANLDKAAVYLAECRVMGIPVLVPDVNVSLSDFAALIDAPSGDASAEDVARQSAADGATPSRRLGSIPFGLSAVRNVGEGLVELLVAEREANGAFTDYFDFCDRVDLNVLNKRTIESLIKAGAFDSMGYPRQGLLMVFESIIDRVVARRRKQAEGQFELFDMLETAPAAANFDDARIDIPTIDFDKKTRLAFEREMLGLYVSDHPLMGAEAALRRRTDGTLNELEMAEDANMRMVGGLVTNLQRKWTKKGDLMAVFILEDLQGAIETMVFPKTMVTYGHMLDNDAVVVMKCRVDKREDSPKLIAMDIEVLSELGNDAAPTVRLKVHPSRATEQLLGDLKDLLSEHPGHSQVLLMLGDSQVVRLPDGFAVDATNGLLAELRVLLGGNAVLV